MTQSSSSSDKQNHKHSTSAMTQGLPQDTTPCMSSQLPVTPNNYYSKVPEYAPHVVETPSVPLWDDSNGMIYAIPDLPRSRSAGVHPGILGGASSPQYESYRATRAISSGNAENSGSGSGVDDAVKLPLCTRHRRGEDGHTAAQVGVPHLSTTPSEPRVAKNFVPYFEPEDARNAQDLRRRTYGSMPPAVFSAGSMSRAQALQNTAQEVQCKRTLIQEKLYPNDYNRMNRRPRKPSQTSSVTLDKVRQLRTEERRLSHMKLSDAALSVRFQELRGISGGSAESSSCNSDLNTQRSSKSVVVCSANVEHLAQVTKEVVGRENIENENREEINALVEKNDTGSAANSVGTSGQNEFECIGAPLWDEREMNGGKKRWYCFRR